MSEPTPAQVRAALDEVRGTLEDLSDAHAWLDDSEYGRDALNVVLARVDHALDEVEVAYPLDTHDWVPDTVNGQAYRWCAVCERAEFVPDGMVINPGVRPCTFERRPEGDPNA